MSERVMERVLVIDDDALSRDVLELLLGSEGYEVTLASSGDAALERLGTEGACPDVVLTDMQMPGTCGEELFRRLRTMCGGALRVIAMSGSVPEGGTPAGANGFLLKPFSTEEFGEVLRGLRTGAGLGMGAGLGTDVERPVGGDSAEVLDAAVFGSFRAMLGDGPLGELYSACVGDAREQWGGMRAAAEEGDYSRLRKFAHALKGSLGMVGARELERMCLALEMGVVNDTYVITLQHFPDAIERLRDMLNALGVSISSNSQR